MERFFKEVEFKNPRHLKKVLNKYTIISEFKKDNPDNELSKLIPNIRINGNGYFLSTIFVLYIIILFEFYYEKFEEIKDYAAKFDNYIEHLVSNIDNREWKVAQKMSIVNNSFKKGEKDKTLTKFLAMRTSISAELDNENIPYFMFKFLNIFTPKINKQFTFRGIAPGDESNYKEHDII